MKNLSISETAIPFDIYRSLREKTGLSPKTEEAAKLGLRNSLYSILVKDGEKAVGMGRVIGDGGCHCQVVDICVLPQYQGRGLGTEIMGKISGFIRSELPESCYISLIADGKAHRLYQKYGFQEVMPVSRGMYLRV